MTMIIKTKSYWLDRKLEIK